MTNLLLTDHDTLKPPFTVRINWVYKFVQHHNTLKTHFSQKYDHQQALCEDSSKIQKWFKLVQSTIETWGITDEDIYNFNETGFTISIIAITKVIIQIYKHICSNLIQPGNQKWITVIKTINASGWVLSSIVIFASKIYHTNWFDNTKISLNWTIAISNNNWTNDQLSFDWLQSVFKLNIKDHTKSIYQFLILNKHNNHFTF